MQKYLDLISGVYPCITDKNFRQQGRQAKTKCDHYWNITKYLINSILVTVFVAFHMFSPCQCGFLPGVYQDRFWIHYRAEQNKALAEDKWMSKWMNVNLIYLSLTVTYESLRTKLRSTSLTARLSGAHAVLRETFTTFIYLYLAG